MRASTGVIPTCQRTHDPALSGISPPNRSSGPGVTDGLRYEDEFHLIKPRPVFAQVHRYRVLARA